MEEDEEECQDEKKNKKSFVVCSFDCPRMSSHRSMSVVVLALVAIFFLSAPCQAYLPVVMMHGIDGSAQDFAPMVLPFSSFFFFFKDKRDGQREH